jgi:hypothetical protein
MCKGTGPQAQFILWLMWQAKNEICMDGIPMAQKVLNQYPAWQRKCAPPKESTEFKKGTCPLTIRIGAFPGNAQ